MIFNDRLADVAERFLQKGRKVYVEGALQTRKWTDQSGQERYTTEVVIGRFSGELTLLDSARGGEGGSAGEGGGSAARTRRTPRRLRVRPRRARRPGTLPGRRPGRRNPVLTGT